MGMLMNVAATLDLPLVDEWWTSWSPKDGEDCPSPHATYWFWIKPP